MFKKKPSKRDYISNLTSAEYYQRAVKLKIKALMERMPDQKLINLFEVFEDIHYCMKKSGQKRLYINSKYDIILENGVLKLEKKGG